MPISFKCPACGAPLDYAGGDETTVKCPYCANVVGVPSELRPAPQPAAPQPAPAAAQTVAPPVMALPTPPGDIRGAIHQRRQARRLERRLGRHMARGLRGR